eukprot:jgi/Psemu1/302372/fgenesh1_kg.67_\
MSALQKHLPSRHSENNFWLKYSLLRDGATMHALEAKSGLTRFNILAIETLKGDVFGCFMTKPWVPSNNQYRPAEQSFLWRLKRRRLTDEECEDTPESESEAREDLIEVFHLTGNNELCQLVAHDKIACLCRMPRRANVCCNSSRTTAARLRRRSVGGPISFEVESNRCAHGTCTMR